MWKFIVIYSLPFDITRLILNLNDTHTCIQDRQDYSESADEYKKSPLQLVIVETTFIKHDNAKSLESKGIFRKKITGKPR